jgi:hypothetical protein
MSTVLFIDANIYLRFYDSKSREMASLLKTLDQISKDIFITTQIANEVTRNKLLCAYYSFKNYSVLPTFEKASFPIQFKSPSIDNWNQKMNEMDSIKNRQDEIIKELLNDISNSSDYVSVTLKTLFESAITPSNDELSLARFRKETGNPPGNNQDPLSDQISWEQLLNKIKPSDNLIFITNDKDYYIKFKDKCYLNPLLVADLVKMKFSLSQLYAYEKLVDGLEKYKEIQNPKIYFPNDTDAKRISEIEQTMINTATVCSSTITSGTSGYSGYSGISEYFDPLYRFLKKF